MPYKNGLVRLTMQMAGNGEIANVSLHVDKADPGVMLTQTSFDLLADRCVEWWNTAIGAGSPHKVFATSLFSFVGVSGLEYTQAGANGNPIPWQKSYAVPGTSTGKQLPLQVCTVVTNLTSLNNRRGRGRAYLPYVTDTQLAASGVMATASLTGVAVQWEGLLEQINALASPAVTCVVYSFLDGVARPITNIRVNTVFDTQRRRMKKLVGTSDTRAITI